MRDTKLYEKFDNQTAETVSTIHSKIRKQRVKFVANKKYNINLFIHNKLKFSNKVQRFSKKKCLGKSIDENKVKLLKSDQNFFLSLKHFRINI